MKRILALVFLALVLMPGAAPAIFAQDLAITNARIIVGNGSVIESGSLVVRAGRIASVGPGAPNAPGVRVIDGRGMTIMPGFIDAHRHIMGGNTEAWLRDQATPRLQEFLEAGYTTLMSGGGPVPGIVELKRRVDSGQLKGPRIITSGRADPTVFKTTEEIRAEVRKNAQAGVEIIKARIEPPADPGEVERLAAAVDEAKKNNLKVMVHATSPKAMLEAVRVGAQKLVHSPNFGWITEADAKVVKDAGVHVLSTVGFGVPVFGVFNQNNQPTFRDGKPWPEGIIDGQGRGREAGEKVINGRTLWDAGVVYGYGTDTGYHPKAGLSHELRTLNLMFSPQDLIKLMGPNTATFIDRSNDLGTLEVGKLADIVMLPGNPLEGYWHMLDVKVVVKGGEVLVDKR
jgi:imidazolonepropionase-like amidohydrolase